jgi:hypothetical protein
MATAHEFELACPACGPGIYAVEDGFRLRVGLTSNLSRFVRRQRTRVRLLHIARMEPGEAPGAWRTLLSHLRAQGLAPKECQFEAGAAHVVAQSMARAAEAPQAPSPPQTSADLHGVLGRTDRAPRQTEVPPWLPRGWTRAQAADQASSQRSHLRSRRSWARSALTNRK